jgi:glyoxylase-like metal-dependent hydrolase (beta-lactamase superfamily II)
MEMIRLAAELIILLGAVNTGVLTSGDKALLFDCGDSVTPERLANIGVAQVDKILCTQHRRVNVSGAYEFVERGAELYVPDAERHLFDKTDEYWSDLNNRWFPYHFQPGPQVLTKPLPVTQTINEGSFIEWEGYRIRVLDTPGATDGAISYLVEVNGTTYCFSGDVLYAPGQVWDLSSLQKGFETRDYHGFLGNMRRLVPSLQKIKSSGTSVIIPSHGEVMHEPESAIQSTIDRLEEAWSSYSSISSLWHYYPDMMAGRQSGGQSIISARTHPDIPFLERIPRTTTSLLKSESGAALIIDCPNERVVTSLREMLKAKRITAIEGAWVTHYHNDHVDGLQRLYRTFGMPIMTHESMAEILEYPRRFFLPCISPNAVPVTYSRKDGERWTWREFELTAYHFPGQTYYHSGLLIEGQGKRIFLGGDSFSPRGIDDYCAGNRNFLGEGRGFDQCLALIKDLKPDAVMNPHQDKGVDFSDDEIERMRRTLAEREKLFAELLPWEHPNFGTDLWWVRTYPYEQDVFRGGDFQLDVQFTNHAEKDATGIVSPVLNDGWAWTSHSEHSTVIQPGQDGAVRMTISVPDHAKRGLHVIPVRVTWNTRYLGQIRHVLVHVM